MSTPQTTIYIVDVPLTSSYEHTYYFKNEADQYSFFWSHKVKTFTNYTYCRKNWDLKVEATLEEANKWRYLFFQNVSSGKLYYYFITQVQYVNDCTVNLSLEMDVIQTYLFDMTLLPSFIERQHAESDGLYTNTVDEGLDTGELVNTFVYNEESIKTMCVLILSTVDLKYVYDSRDDSPAVYYPCYPSKYDGVYSGLGVYAINDVEVFDNLLTTLDRDGKTSAIVNMWMYPGSVIEEKKWDSNGVMQISSSDLSYTTLVGAYAHITGGSYVPRNKKLYCYPYNFLYVTNNAGASAVYRWEDMRETPEGYYKFLLRGAISPEATVRMYPEYYAGAVDAYDYGLNTAVYPSVAWDSDVYKVWLAQNQNSHDFTTQQAKITAVAGALTAVGSAAMGNVAGSAGGLATAYHGLSKIEQLNALKKDMAIQPPQACGSFSTNVNVSAGRHSFTFMGKCPKDEYLRKIDDYFTRYGYRMNRIAIPNLCARQNYTYIKTVACHVAGQLCSEDLNKIASVFDNGVTFWNVFDNNTCLFGYYNENPEL